MKDSIKIFISFLKENKCYAKYKDNFFIQNQFTTFGEFINANKLESFILNAFIWSNTEEGICYWSHINDLWNIFKYKNKISK